MSAGNLLLKRPKYKITDTGAGVWREYLYDNGQIFRDYRSHTTLFGLPLVSRAQGRNPETGRMAVAKGVLAIGQRASGFVAIGQFSRGFVAVGQFSAGAVISVGQFSVAPLCIGQFALGYAAIGQIGAALFGVFQQGFVGWGIGQNLVSWFS